jgi:hypothetical protein
MGAQVIPFPALPHPADRLWDAIAALDALERGRAVVRWESRTEARERLRRRMRSLCTSLALAEPAGRIGRECEAAICSVTGRVYVKRREPMSESTIGRSGSHGDGPGLSA